MSGRFAYPFAWRSLIDAHRGRLDRARSTLVPLVNEAVGGEKSWWAAQLLAVQGVVEFVAGELHAADRALSQMRLLLDQIGMKDGLLDRTEPFHVELLVQLGQLERARELLGRLEAKARAYPRPWVELGLPRARAVVTAADGDVTAAIEELHALDVSAAQTLPLEAGFNWLTKGRLLRRAKQRRAAADALCEAVAIFERLGALTWVGRAREESDLVGPRRRAPDELTAAELRVAELAATGITNREISRAAFMSEKTVEAHMARIYRKFGIRSRAELGALMASAPSSTSPKT